MQWGGGGREKYLRDRMRGHWEVIRKIIKIFSTIQES